MHRVISGRPLAVLVAVIALSMLVFNHRKKKKRSAEKESTDGASAPAGGSNPPFISPIPTGGGRSVEAFVASILLFMIVLDHHKKKKKSAEKESTEGASALGEGSNFPLIFPGGCSDSYDVFLSFRGSDTRDSFADSLYHELISRGNVPAFVFRDDHSIPIGEEFGPFILNAISQSKISIPIISENYASSKWCLLELFHIMKCRKSKSHIVLPIFYKVEPAHVRYLLGKFGEAFHSHKKRFNEKDIQEWRQALIEVSDLNGWVSMKFPNGFEGKLVKEVIKTVQNKLRENFQLDVPQNLVGITDHVNKFRKWAATPAKDARMIGIYGMGGIGKTTLAKVIYNKLSNDFFHRSYLSSIREKAKRNDVHLLQKQLIDEILENEHQVRTLDQGINLIKLRFKGKKVLILLDDIDNKNQLDALARERDWFSSGSIIIVTTRNTVVLDQPKFEADCKYELNEINGEHSLLLFNRIAFQMDHSLRGFEAISQDIVSTIGGLPCALTVVGEDLYPTKDQEVWQDVLKKLKKEQYVRVQNNLKISYDALEDGHKEVFLDIACFFIGEEKKLAIYMWEDCNSYPSLAIRELKRRCLIKIGDHGELRMHDQLRVFGRNIACQEGLPQGRSRFLVGEEAFIVDMGNKGPYTVKAICLDKSDDPLQTYTDKQFENLQSLRFLKLRAAALSGDFNGLFSELKWLHWFGIDPIQPFWARNLHLPKLEVLQLSNNEITEHWVGWSSITAAKQLKVLDLARCKYLICTPNLSAFTKLEILILKHCDQLKKVDPSIGKVTSLVSLDLSCCISLKELPREVGELVKLKELILDFAGLIEIPSSISSLGNLEKLSAKGCRSLKEIPGEIGHLSSLKILEISRAPLSNLPSFLSLSSLQHLRLQDCYKLQSLPELPQGLTYMMVSHHCPRLPRVSCPFHQEELVLEGCDLFEYIPELPSRSLEEFSLEAYNPLENIPGVPSTSLKICVVSCHKLILPLLNRFEYLPLPKKNIFEYLEELSIESCSSIERLDLSQFKHLKRLRTKYCYNLVEIQGHDHLKFMGEIVIDCCRSIKRLILPKLQCLKQLKAYSCDNLVEIQGLERAELLETLHISKCGSIERLPELSCFATLKELNINGCGNLLGVENLERFLSCRSIYITGCKSLEILPNLSNFTNLENFTMRYSLGVTEIPGIKESRSLTYIDITGCESIQNLSDLSGCHKLLYLVVRDCKRLTQLRGLEKLGLIYLDISGCDRLEPIPQLPGTSVCRHYEGWPYELFSEKINLCEMIMLW